MLSAFKWLLCCKTLTELTKAEPVLLCNVSLVLFYLQVIHLNQLKHLLKITIAIMLHFLIAPSI